MKRRKYFYKNVVINVRNAEELQRVGEERDIVQTTKRRKLTELVTSFIRTAF
jgi:hypothetical protein